MSPPFETELLARVEEAGINASAPREQLWVDGWLVRFSPGKAKRARCIQAVASGRLPVAARLERCLAIYAAAGLRPYVRVTPFSEPAHLDEQLADTGMERIDDTKVMIAAMSGVVGTAKAATELRFEPASASVFAQWIGARRGSSAAECRAHAERLRDAPVPHRAVLVAGSDGEVIAGGQVAVEGDVAGLYDIFTTEGARRRGIAQALCRHLLETAAELGASTAYLQVDAGNDAARRIYRQLGFADAYSYHYRAPPVP